MAWGVGTTKADAQAYEVGLETDVAEADVDSTSFYLDDTVAWYGEDETYGTQADWLTGEGLTSAWGPDQDKIQSTYSNPISEYIGEDPVANLLVDARGMLRRGGQPSGWDIANLGLSVVPGLGPAAVKAAKPVGTAIKRSIQDWGKRKHKYVDWDVDQHITATTDPTFKETGFRNTLQGKALEKLGMLPEFKDLNKPIDPQMLALYDEYVLKDKYLPLKTPEEIEQMKRGVRNWDKAWVAKHPELKSWMDEIHSDPKNAERLRLLAVDSALPPSTTGLPQNVSQLPSAKPIQDMTWREWDDLSDSPFTLSDKQNGMMRAQGITDPDDVLDHFWGQGARQDFMGWLEEAVAKTKQDFAEELEFVRYRDLKSGYIDEMTPAQLSNDLAWKGTNVPGSIDHLAVAEKMSWRPDSISHQDWARFTKDMTMKEVERAARKLALRIVD